MCKPTRYYLNPLHFVFERLLLKNELDFKQILLLTIFLLKNIFLQIGEKIQRTVIGTIISVPINSIYLCTVYSPEPEINENHNKIECNIRAHFDTSPPPPFVGLNLQGSEESICYD